MRHDPVKRDAEDEVSQRVAFLPDLATLRGNPYWDLLAMSLRRYGVEVLESNPNTLSLSWLLRNRRTISILHYHYIQEEYAYEHDYARLRWVVRFSRSLLVAHLLGYRIVWTMHNTIPVHPLEPAWIEHLAHWLIAQLSNSVIVHCEAAKEILLQKYGRRSGVVIAQHPNFIGFYPNLSDKALARASLGLTETQRVVLYFGGIRPNKGIESLIAAFGAFNDPEAQLIIAGAPQVNPSYARQLMDEATHDGRVIFRGERIPDDEVHVLFNAADLVVLPFTNVLTSSSLALAMSFGRPVIAPRMGCMPDVLTPDVGWLFEPNNIEALTQTIAHAFESDLDRIGCNVYERIRSYTWDQFVQQTMLAYGMH